MRDIIIYLRVRFGLFIIIATFNLGKQIYDNILVVSLNSFPVLATILFPIKTSKHNEHVKHFGKTSI